MAALLGSRNSRFPAVRRAWRRLEFIKTTPSVEAMVSAMAGRLHASKPLRVLVSEGSSTSAREAITILGLGGHHVEVCDPDRYCLARFSRLVRKVHRCPGLRDDPAGFLSFVEQMLASRSFDILLPTHEQGFLFARMGRRLSDRVGLALPRFESYRAAHSKAGFSRLLDHLGMAQPATQMVKSENELRAAVRFPSVVKTAIGTASRGVWFVRRAGELDGVVRDVTARGLCPDGNFADEVLVQELVAGPTEKMQAVFCRGQLSGFHGYRRMAPGVGGGEAVKQSVTRAEVRSLLAGIGKHLDWHGALSVDYIMSDHGAPLLIDCNPRLVEPMSAYLAGVDLVGLLLAISMGETPNALPASRDGVRTRLAMQALLGCASTGGRRREIAQTCWRLSTARGPYADSLEELTPLRLDWISAVPLAMTAMALLVAPKLAGPLASHGWGAHLLDRKSIGLIMHEDFGRPR